VARYNRPMTPSLRGYQFGPYTFDLASGDLTQADGGTTRLQPQVAALLAALLERAGDVVSRADLRTRLWPDTTVDFDDGLNFCMRQLRVALGDDASAPVYIETLPRRGYRFRATARALESDGHAPGSAVEETRGRPPNEGPRFNVGRVIAFALVAVSVVAVSIAIARKSRAPVGPPAATLALLRFEVDSADPLMAAYHRRLIDQMIADARQETRWRLSTDTSEATHFLSGILQRQGYSVRIFVQLVRRSDRRHLWADSIIDTYPFSGNSTLTADRIERSVSRLLTPSTAPAP